ncbi:MAG: PIN domain-containing protein [Bacteroidales bacterium]|jgi:tRNA(fMet)-specific endonuclease VapC|nr:PIN domain-containing protein [Bacteroidales bacterium]
MQKFKYLLDTSTCIELLRGNKNVRQFCIEYSQLCCISEITAIELYYGAYNAPPKYQKQELLKAEMLIESYKKIGIDNIAGAFCHEKIRLETSGEIIEDFDLMIGVSARENNLIVVTHNVKHFCRIDNLVVEDWTDKKIDF